MREQAETVGAKPPGANQHKDRVTKPEAPPTLAETGIDKTSPIMHTLPAG